jgi:D-alanine-D-alanine ligase
MERKIRVGILFGGRSAEHEVSLQSARNVIEAINREKYEVVLIGIDKKGSWHFHDQSRFLLNADDPKRIQLNRTSDTVALVPGEKEQQLISLSDRTSAQPVDVVFPILHGTYGEDGTVQGMLKLAGVPFVGAGVLGSAVGMDKDVMKRLFREAGIPTPDFLVFNRSSRIDFDEVKARLGLPVFVKPANLGSSVGVSKAKDESGFKKALQDAFRYDHKILIEESISGREIECSVLGNENPIASLPGEVLPRHEFYSYEAKYIDESGAALEIPAKLPKEIIEKVQILAVRTYKTLCCEGMARVDMFLKKEDELLVNEINTIPGFTNISMYPKLWGASGIPYTELIDRLIQLALDRFESEKKLETEI